MIKLILPYLIIFKKITSLILNPIYKNNKFHYANPSILGGLLDLIYLSTQKENFKIIIDPFELFKKNKYINILIFKIAYTSIKKKRINYLLNFIYYLYYRSNLYTKNIDNIKIKGFVHGNNQVYESLSKQKKIYFDTNFSQSNNNEINDLLKKKCLVFSCRDSAYKKFTSKINSSYHSYRNESLVNYEKALLAFKKENFNIIRFGSVAENKCENKNIYDYTFSKFRNEINDLVLMKNCELYVGTWSGPDILALNFQKPIVWTNAINIPYVYTFQSHVVTIFKKFYDQKKNEFIPYKYLLDLNYKFKNENIPVGAFNQTSFFEKYNIKLIENTDDEIFNAVKEMINYKNGKFKFDSSLQDKFKKPYIKLTKNSIKPNFFVSEYFIKKNISLFS